MRRELAAWAGASLLATGCTQNHVRGEAVQDEHASPAYQCAHDKDGGTWVWLEAGCRWTCRDGFVTADIPDGAPCPQADQLERLLHDSTGDLPITRDNLIPPRTIPPGD
jgi:hypothetical protein